LKVLKYKSVGYTESTCDECGQICIYHCTICQKDLCRDHSVVGDMWDDYSNRYCKSCWDIGEPFRKDLEFLETNFEIAKGDIQEKWEKSCKDVDKTV